MLKELNNNKYTRVIAIDGCSASGKGTIAKFISKELNIPYLNTGALYRAVGVYLNKNNFIDFSNIDKMLSLLKHLKFDNLDNEELYTEDAGRLASNVAKIQEVRQFLFNLQRDFVNNPNGAVLDGRDIGTVICPEAKYKFFITASAEERAKRRTKELLEKGLKVDYDTILNQLKERDYADTHRSVNPLRKADDAIEVDTSNLNKEEACRYVLGLIKKTK